MAVTRRVTATQTKGEFYVKRSSEFVITRRQIATVLLILGLVLAAVLALPRLVASQKTAAEALQEQSGVRVIPATSSFTVDGIQVAYSVQPDSNQSDLTDLQFTVTDTSTGKLAETINPPAIWISSIKSSGNGNGQAKEILSCDDRIRLYLQGTLDFRPDVDMTSYYILALNEDASISVINPAGGVSGISQLYTMIVLESNGEDWALSANGDRLFVSMPQAGKVAVIDTGSFKVIKNIEVGNNPTRLALQPDGRYLWVSNEADGLTPGGMAIIDTAALTMNTRLSTGLGQQSITFYGDGVHKHEENGQLVEKSGIAFLTSSQSQKVTVVETHNFTTVAEVPVNIHPTSLSFASASNTVYAASETENTVVAINAVDYTVSANVETGQDNRALLFDPEGRWGFALSANQNQVVVVDASNHQVAATVAVKGQPDKVSFTHTYGYIHLSDSAEVAIFDLAQLKNGQSLSPVHVIGGRTAPQDARAKLTIADAIVPIHEHGNHVLIANPGDQSIYYYMEGMNAPMSAYQNYGRSPRAVQIVSRALTVEEPGVFQGKFKLPSHGTYEVAFLLDSPRVVQCFTIATQDANLNAEEAAALEIRFVSGKLKAASGENLPVRFTLTDPATGQPVIGLQDVAVMAVTASGLNQEQFSVTPLGNGQYETNLNLANPGVYNVYFSVPSYQIDFTDLPHINVEITAAGNQP